MAPSAVSGLSSAPISRCPVPCGAKTRSVKDRHQPYAAAMPAMRAVGSEIAIGSAGQAAPGSAAEVSRSGGTSAMPVRIKSSQGLAALCAGGNRLGF